MVRILEVGSKLIFKDSDGKPHLMSILDISDPDEQGMRIVRYELNTETFPYPVKVSEALQNKANGIEMADENNPCHVASPSNGDLWIVYVKPGDIVREGEELFNITIMKQEKSILSPVAGEVKRVVKYADYKKDKKMVPVRSGELIIELGPVPQKCRNCSEPVSGDSFHFCPFCGKELNG